MLNAQTIYWRIIMVNQISSKEFQKIIGQNKVVVVDYFASWCMPCQMMAKVVEDVAKDFSNIEFTKINVDEETNLAIQQHIEAVPTFVAYKNGKEINRMLGYHIKEEFKEFLDSL